MSILPLSNENVELTTLLLQPSQSFTTSSAGMTGSIFLVSRPSPSIKTLVGSANAANITYSESLNVTDDDDLLYSASVAVTSGDKNIADIMTSYLSKVRAQPTSPRDDVVFKPAVYFSKGTTGTPGYTDTTSIESGQINTEDRFNWQNFQRKIIKNCLVPDAIVENPRSAYGYTNYHALNFMSRSLTTTGQVALIYPNYVPRPYTPTSAFSLDFFVKPKKSLDTTKPYAAGTIFHLSSSLAVSITSGSQTAADGSPSSFRLLFQIYSGSSILPTNIDPVSYLPNTSPKSAPYDQVFASDDVLQLDKWHHISIRWDPARSYGSGSIKIDDNYTRSFCFPSRSVDPYGSLSTPGGLVIGNFYDSGDSISKFFNGNTNNIDGTVADPNASTSDPTGFTFSCPLNAELHQVSLFKRYITDDEINDIASTTAESGSTGPSFYLPVVFTGSTPAYSTYTTPKLVQVASTDSPFSYNIAAGYNGYYLNLQNFIVDFATKRLPRAYNCHSPTVYGSAYDVRTQNTDDVLMTFDQIKRRNFLIAPCDNGTFVPSYARIASDGSRFTSSDPAQIDMKQLVPNDIVTITPIFSNTSMPYDGIKRTTNTLLPVLQNYNANFNSGYEDLSSNLVTVLSIPSPFYGTKIVPGTVVITDASVSGSDGQMFTLVDDGFGNLSRNNTVSTPALWNRVGSVFYSHGIIALFSPHIPYFAKNGYTISFKGESRRHVVSITVPALPNTINTSRNPSYKDFSPTNLISEQSEDFVYVTGINLHDQNFNVVMRAKLAQVVQKRDSDELVFRLRYDF
jgi:hypothetical protein